MLLTDLTLHNFGVYKGRHDVDLLPPSLERPVILIGGLNGAGKTTFLDALQLSLYGHRARTSNRGQAGYEEYLRSCINTSVDSSDGAMLELGFQVDRDGRTVTYRVRRSWATQGSRTLEHVRVSMDGQDDQLLADAWADHIEEIIPLDISSLFFFDGEKIESLADPDRAQSVIRSAVQSLLGLGVVDRLTADLQTLQRRQRPAVADQALDARITALETAYERAQAERLAANDRLGRARIDVGQAVSTFEKAEATFSASGGDLLKERHALEADQVAAAESTKRIEDVLRQQAAGAAPLLLIQDLLGSIECQGSLEAKQQTMAHLANVLEQRDEQVLAAAQGQLPTKAVSIFRALLQEDRRSRQPAAEFEPVLNLDADALRSINMLRHRLAETRAACQSLLAQLSDAKDQLVLCDRRLAAVPPAESVAALLAKRNEARDAMLALQGRCAALEEDVDRLSRIKSECRAQLEAAQFSRVEQALDGEDSARIVAHADRARQTLANYRTKLLARHLGKLEVAVLESFRQLMRKQELVSDLRIDAATFELTLFSSAGDSLEAKKLSAGERQLLAVAILWGLAKVAGNRLPTVIDTPLGRLDSVHRNHLVERYFPFASRQVLLLSTDKEIDRDLQHLLLPSVGHSYLVAFDEKSSSSQFTAGYFWDRSSLDVA